VRSDATRIEAVTWDCSIEWSQFYIAASSHCIEQESFIVDGSEGEHCRPFDEDTCVSIQKGLGRDHEVRNPC
jgi:hypothetical protein